jgi:hypothetical protein
LAIVAVEFVWYGFPGAPTEIGLILQEIALWAVMFGGVPVGGVAYLVYRRIVAKLFVREWVQPLHAALAKPLERPEWGDSSYITIPRDLWSNVDAKVRINLPASFGAEMGKRELIKMAVQAKLALPQAEYSWNLAGRLPFLEVKQAPQPPTRVMLEDVIGAMNRAAENAPVVGLGIRRKVIALNFDLDAPHILLSMGTGGGKSTFSKMIACQILGNGGFVIFLDKKRVSHMWADGLPNVAYCRELEDIHNALVILAMEGMRRFRILEANGGDEECLKNLPRIYVVFEEMNATMDALKRYWQNIRKPTDPRTSPAIDGFNDVTFLGRQAKMNACAIGQSGTVRMFGGYPEGRENYGMRFLGRYSANAARMLCPDVKLPPASRILGRVMMYLGGDAEPVQPCYLSAQQARAYVLEHQARRGVAVSHVAGVTSLALALSTLGQGVGHVTGETWENDSPHELEGASDGPVGEWPAYPPDDQGDAAEELLTIAEAIAPRGPLEGRSKAAARRASQRPGFPRPGEQTVSGNRYRRDELEAYADGKRFETSGVS